MSGITGVEALQLNVTVMTSMFQIRGVLPVLGMLLTFVNDEQKGTLVLRNAQVTGLEPNNGVNMAQQEVMITKKDAQVILFETNPPQSIVTLPPRAERLICYVDRFAVAARFYMGQDSRISDFAEVSKQQFLPISDVKLYPLGALRSGLSSAAQLGLIHKTALRMYHTAQ